MPGFIRLNETRWTGNKVEKARLNKESLHKMAIRQATAIKASIRRTQVLSLLSKYLEHIILELGTKDYTPYELATVELDLEAVDAALKHLWVNPPYNEVLTTPRSLPQDQIHRLRTMAYSANRMGRHLRLAVSG